LDLMTRKEVKEMLRLSESTIIRFEKAGKLMPIKFEKKVLYDKKDIEEFIASAKQSNGE